NLQNLRGEAMTMFRENPKRAVQLGVTNDAGTPLDSRKVFPSGRANPRYGRPMPKTNTISIITGLVTIERDGKKEAPVPFSAIVDRNSPDSKMPAVFHRVTFPITGADFVEEQKLWRLGV